VSENAEFLEVTDSGFKRLRGPYSSIIKSTRCTRFTNLFWSWNSTCFGQFVCSSSGVYSLYTQQRYMLYRFVDSFRAGPRWNCSSILVLLESCLQTCTTYTIAGCTV